MVDGIFHCPNMGYAQKWFHMGNRRCFRVVKSSWFFFLMSVKVTHSIAKLTTSSSIYWGVDRDGGVRAKTAALQPWLCSKYNRRMFLSFPFIPAECLVNVQKP
jgi:hypothetical protein